VKVWRKANPGKRAEYERNKRATDPEYRLMCNVRNKNNYHKDIELSREKNKLKSRRLRAINPDPKEHSLKRSERYHKAKYGITLEEKKQMLANQGGKCAICSSEHHNARYGWAVDHCHSTNKVRGILCGKCNHAIGLLCDNPQIAISAAQYLEHHQNVTSSSKS
jgi:hypothetical protein